MTSNFNTLITQKAFINITLDYIFANNFNFRINSHIWDHRLSFLLFKCLFSGVKKQNCKFTTVPANPQKLSCSKNNFLGRDLLVFSLCGGAYFTHSRLNPGQRKKAMPCSSISLGQIAPFYLGHQHARIFTHTPKCSVVLYVSPAQTTEKIYVQSFFEDSSPRRANCRFGSIWETLLRSCFVLGEQWTHAGHRSPAGRKKCTAVHGPLRAHQSAMRIRTPTLFFYFQLFLPPHYDEAQSECARTSHRGTYADWTRTRIFISKK